MLAGLLRGGAADAWLVPIVMKKGRPAHTLSRAVPTRSGAALRDLIFAETTTLGVREHAVRKHALPAPWSRSTSTAAPVRSRWPTGTA